jgi:hypothetical protein
MNDRFLDWRYKMSPNVNDALDFINGRGAYKQPVTAVKICMAEKSGNYEFHIYYQRVNGSPCMDGWNVKTATDPDDAFNFLNGKGPYKDAVSDARISGFSTGGQLRFFIFYRCAKVVGVKGWGWKLASDVADAQHFLNGDGPYSNSVERAEIVTALEGNNPYFYIFYKSGLPGQPSGTWDTRRIRSAAGVREALNLQGNNHPSPVHDAKIVTSYRLNDTTWFFVFYPPLFLIITRPLFVGSLSEYINWKYAHGFEVCLITAEWIDAHEPGKDIMIKIRNCIRHYVRFTRLKFALMVGDSEEITDALNEPPQPLLSQTWNLPAGYYHKMKGHEFTTIYYSDQTDNDDIGNAPLFTGDYPVAIGVIPVRTTAELCNVLFKTMNAGLTKQFSMILSSATYLSPMPGIISEIESLAGKFGIQVYKAVFDKTA